MKKITSEKIKEMIQLHKLWMDGDNNGMCADFSDYELKYVDFSNLDLSGAKFNNANLYGANFKHSYLYNTEFCNANLKEANLCGAHIGYTNMDGIKINEITIGIPMNCPEEGSFIGYTAFNNKIIVLEIQNDSYRTSGTTLKCRCSKAKVLRIENINGTISYLTKIPIDDQLVFEVGKIIEVPNFDQNRWHECWNEYKTGIHFYMSKFVARQK